VAAEAAHQLGVSVWETWVELSALGPRLGLQPVRTVPIRRATASELGIVPEPQDVALFLHTSGTTGRPKGTDTEQVQLLYSPSFLRPVAKLY